VSVPSLLVTPPSYTRFSFRPQTDAFAFGILLIELLTDLHPQDARELVDAYTELKSRTNRLRECAKENNWISTGGARTTVCEIAAECTAGSATRKSPAQVLTTLEGIYNNGTFVPRGGAIGRALGRFAASFTAL
jgi:hypothetical protein